MNRTLHVATLLLMLGAAPLAGASDQPVRAVIETSVETTGAGAHFPDSLSGKIEVLGCAHCVDHSLQLRSDTRFTLNGAVITLAQMRQAAAGASGKYLTIHYTLADRQVTRVDLVSF